MNSITTVYNGDLRTSITHIESQTTIATDAPTDNNGLGRNFSPTDLFAASLCSCVLTIAGMAAKKHGFDIDGSTATTTKIMGSSPRRIAEIIIKITLPHNNYSDKHKKIIEACAKECPVAQSLHPETKKTITFIYNNC